jgi:hypothetical protein
MKFLQKVEALRMGGPAGPINIDKARDKEIEFKQGLPKLRYTIRPRLPKKLDEFHKGKGGPYESDQGSYPFVIPDLLSFPDRGWPQQGRNAPTRGEPTEETLPVKKVLSKVDPKKQETEEKDKLKVKVTPPKEEAAKPEDVKVEKVENRPKFFTQLIGVVRGLFPSFKMKFPTPPTYVWNPGQPKPEGEEEEGPKEVKPLDPKDIKDKLKMKFSDLAWSKNYDGVDTADYVFPDNSRAEFAIGQDADHLTVTYFSPGH